MWNKIRHLKLKGSEIKNILKEICKVITIDRTSILLLIMNYQNNFSFLLLDCRLACRLWLQERRLGEFVFKFLIVF